MTMVLLDANVLVYLASPSSPQSVVCRTAVERIIERGEGHAPRAIA
jgi:predicted nucleic acid-binding protein